MRSPLLSTVSPALSMMGLDTFSIAIFGGFYAYHFVTGDATSLRAANLGMETFLFSGISTQILKNMFGRERPSMRTKEGGRWSGPLSYFEHRGQRQQENSELRCLSLEPYSAHLRGCFHHCRY